MYHRTRGTPDRLSRRLSVDDWVVASFEFYVGKPLPDHHLSGVRQSLSFMVIAKMFSVYALLLMLFFVHGFHVSLRTWLQESQVGTWLSLNWLSCSKFFVPDFPLTLHVVALSFHEILCYIVVLSSHEILCRCASALSGYLIIVMVLLHHHLHHHLYHITTVTCITYPPTCTSLHLPAPPAYCTHLLRPPSCITSSAITLRYQY
jgi:hypothetical protein